MNLLATSFDTEEITHKLSVCLNSLYNLILWYGLYHQDKGKVFVWNMILKI